MAESRLRAKTLRVLGDGRVTVGKAHGFYAGVPGPQKVEARVASSRPHVDPHRVARDVVTGSWSCTCGAATTCPHIAAVQLVTGWPSEARR